MRFISHALCFVAGLFAALVITATPSGSATTMHTVNYPTGELQLECPLDSRGRLHGELKMYYPSSRVMSVTPYSHGYPGTRSYYDPVPDEAQARAESTD